MKVLILYRPNSEDARAVETFARDFGRIYPNKRLETVSIDTRDGAATQSLYDILDHPAILAMKDDGSVLQMWQGKQLPLMSDVAGYVNS